MENEVFFLLPQKRKASQWDASVCQKSIILIYCKELSLFLLLNLSFSYKEESMMPDS